MRADLDGKTGGQLNSAHQSMAQYSAMIGDEDAAMTHWRAAFPKAAAGPEVDLTDTKAEDAVAAIVEASRGRRVVILNEAHHISHNRRFAEKVAVALAAEGFNVFAAETFYPGRPEAVPGAVTMGDGYYARDPVFAEMLRTVKAKGYRLVAYEQRDDQEAQAGASPAEQIAAREEAEAVNLIDMALKDPGARVLVYCGFSHLAEMPSPRGDLWFAARLKAKTGTDPLTIEQSAGKPAPTPDGDGPVMTAVRKRFRYYPSIVVRRPDGSCVMTPGQSWLTTDLAVFHERREPMNDRPFWLDADGRHLTLLSLEDAPKGELRLLQAVPEAELALSAAAVPADQYLLKPDDQRGSLYLRRGRYVLRVETTAGFHRIGAVTV